MEKFRPYLVSWMRLLPSEGGITSRRGEIDYNKDVASAQQFKPQEERKNKHMKKFTILLALVSIAGAIVAGCSKSEDTGGTAGDKGATKDAPADKK